MTTLVLAVQTKEAGNVLVTRDDKGLILTAGPHCVNSTSVTMQQMGRIIGTKADANTYIAPPQVADTQDQLEPIEGIVIEALQFAHIIYRLVDEAESGVYGIVILGQLVGARQKSCLYMPLRGDLRDWRLLRTYKQDRIHWPASSELPVMTIYSSHATYDVRIAGQFNGQGTAIEIQVPPAPPDTDGVGTGGRSGNPGAP